jgi:hypothetical protein
VTRRSAATTPIGVAVKTAAAADTLMAWLQTQPRAARGRFPDVASPEAESVAAVGMEVAHAQSVPVDVAPVTPTRAATLPAPIATAIHDTGCLGHEAPLRLAHTDWLYHRLSVFGPEAALTDFRTVAAGAGTVPWPLDHDRMAEDIFHLLVAPTAGAGSLVAPARSLSLAAARILADQLCAAVARRHALAVGRVGHSRACPFDLHALIPVPNAVLLCGHDDPAALDWLWAHWGTTQPLRHVEEVGVGAATRERPAAGEAAWAVAFWSADWTPWRALAQMTAHRPALRFDMRPLYNTP